MERAEVASPCDDVQLQRNRSAVLDYLYEVDGRSDPNHKYAFTYTNLVETYRYRLGQMLLEEVTRNWHFEQSPTLVVGFAGDEHTEA
ncbi:MAG: hypothetical protein RLZZ515_441 [Cyanobacteriota bacterium]|jgi:hypothetical protein